MENSISVFPLCQIIDCNDFLGISPDRDEDKIIATLGKKAISIIKLNEQKCLQSWSTLDKLSSRVVYDRKSEKYVGVFANSYLRFWDESTVDISSKKRFKFTKYIEDLVCYEDTILIIFKDGTCDTLASALESRKNYAKDEIDLKQENSCLNAKMSQLAGNRKCLTFFEYKNNQLTLMKLNLDLMEDAKIGTISVEEIPIIRDLDVNVIGYAVIDNENGPMLLTIWSDKRLFIMNLDTCLMHEKTPGRFFATLNVLRGDKPITIEGISTNTIAIYGANSKDDDTASLLFYNTQFKVIKAQHNIAQYLPVKRLWSLGKNIFIALANDLSMVHYNIAEELLVDMIGSLASNKYANVLEIDNSHEEDTLHENIKIRSGDTIKAKALTMQFISDNSKPIFADGKYIPFNNMREMDNDLNAMKMSQIHVVVNAVNAWANEQIDVHLTSHMYDDGFACDQIRLIAAHLEKSGASEQEIAANLLPIMMEADLIKDMATCLRRYRNITEEMLSKVLHHLLKNIVNATNDHQQRSSTASDGRRRESRDHDAPQICDHSDVLNIVLCCSFDADTLAYYIHRDIDYQQLLFLLKYLYASITDTNHFFWEINGFGSNFADGEMQIVRWFSVLLIAHFQLMCLSLDIDLIEVFHMWHLLLSSYKDQMDTLTDLYTTLCTIVEHKDILKDDTTHSYYSVDEVILF